MSNMKQRLVHACAAIGLASFALLAGAQEHQWNSCKDQANKEECRHAQMAKFQAMHEAKLHDSLKITAAQEPAWKTFTESLHQQRDAMMAQRHEMPAHADMEKMSAPERLEKHLAMMQKHQAQMQTLLTSLKAFYAVLTPEQQVTMDKHVARFMKHRHHHHHHHWHHHHGVPQGEHKVDQAPAAATKQ
ncbi:Spy/CpxP family protein refolding chaperone [Solimicrobium silvestre]|uniref:LTXXQ motif family protein n=1 Tax=Solimicrobium silvestre TaxID=2099400 RepID=A0A2S9GWB9_9BURK|nr:Spy/CpxP family protein refolding chaperone [Solimicrobium silvestre]PRC92019.1 LTXXQ motif family protein [Solimicrobium silvestre]